MRSLRRVVSSLIVRRQSALIPCRPYRGDLPATQNKISIFWDFGTSNVTDQPKSAENCVPPSKATGHANVSSVRDIGLRYRTTMCLDVAMHTSPLLRLETSSARACLVDCAHNGE